MMADISSARTDLFTTLARESTLATRVTGLVENLIVESRLQPGDRLPPERELAQQFGVSRTVIREAVRALVAKSLLEVRPGSGTIIRSPTAQSVAQSMSLFLRAGQAEAPLEKALEVRGLLEVEIAGLAAVRRVDDDLQALEGALHAMDDVRERNQFVETDLAFHTALAKATHNELFPLLLHSLGDLMITLRQLAFDVPDTPARANRHHRAIYERVKAGDAAGACEAMREHLREARETMQRARALDGEGIER